MGRQQFSEEEVIAALRDLEQNGGFEWPNPYPISNGRPGSMGLTSGRSPPLSRLVFGPCAERTKKALIARAQQVGLAREMFAAVKVIDYRLRIYPQFGEPLRDLASEPGQEWIACVAPLVVRYILFEERRLVCLVVPFLSLPGSGL